MKNSVFTSLLVGAIALVSCTEQSLVPDDQKNQDDRNIQAYVYTYWGGAYYKADSVYQLNDAEIDIKSIEIVFSDYNFSLSTADTVDADTSYTVANLSSQVHKIGLLPRGTYTGEHQITIGFDSAGYNMPYSEAPDALLADDIYRGNVGYNHLVIKGKYRELTDTVNLKPHLDFTYRLGGEDFALHFEKPMSFSVTANNPVSVFFNFNIDVLFQGGLSPAILSEIQSDPNNNDDWAAAQFLYANFEQAINLK